MNPEKQELIDDLLADEGRGDATLRAAAIILRRRRRWRAVRFAGTLLALIAALAWTLGAGRQSPIVARITPAPAVTPPSAESQSLTDDQLLSLFPDTPVGLATLPNGKKLLIFLRPADDAKYATRLSVPAREQAQGDAGI